MKQFILALAIFGTASLSSEASINMIRGSSVPMNTSAFSCENRAKALLNDQEKYVINKHPLMLKAYLDCNSKTYGLEVIIHEAVHMEDVGAPKFKTFKELERWSKNEENIKFNLYTTEHKYLGEIAVNDFPTPNELVNTFLRQNYPDIIEDDSNAILSLVEGYIDDLGTLAARSFSQGITELNAYAHGLKTEYRLKKEHEQRYGLLGFTFFLKAYLYQLKKEYPEKFDQLKSLPNRNYISSLLHQTADVLVETSHCTNMDETELRDFIPLLSDERYLDAIKEILLSDLELKRILCL